MYSWIIIRYPRFGRHRQSCRPPYPQHETEWLGERFNSETLHDLTGMSDQSCSDLGRHVVAWQTMGEVVKTATATSRTLVLVQGGRHVTYLATPLSPSSYRKAAATHCEHSSLHSSRKNFLEKLSGDLENSCILASAVSELALILHHLAGKVFFTNDQGGQQASLHRRYALGQFSQGYGECQAFRQASRLHVGLHGCRGGTCISGWGGRFSHNPDASIGNGVSGFSILVSAHPSGDSPMLSATPSGELPRESTGYVRSRGVPARSISGFIGFAALRLGQ